MERRASSADAGVAHVGTDWFRPAGSRWGASPDLGEALKKLRGVVRQIASKDVDATSILVVPLSVKKEGPRRFKRLFDQCYVAAGGYLSPAVEVVLLRGVGAMVLCGGAGVHVFFCPHRCLCCDREGLTGSRRVSVLSRPWPLHPCGPIVRWRRKVPLWRLRQHREGTKRRIGAP